MNISPTTMASNCRSVFLSIIVLLLLLAPTLSFLYAYISQNSPQSRKPLLIHLLSFSSSNFRIIASKLLEAEWRADLTFENQYDDCKLHIKPFEVVVYYKERYAVSCGLVGSINLEKKNQKRVSIGFNTSSTTACRDPGKPYGHLEKHVLREIREEKRKAGSLSHLSLKMNMQHLSYYKGIDRWDLSLNPSCSDIKVSFVDARNGKFMGDEICSIPW